MPSKPRSLKSSETFAFHVPHRSAVQFQSSNVEIFMVRLTGRFRTAKGLTSEITYLFVGAFLPVFSSFSLGIIARTWEIPFRLLPFRTRLLFIRGTASSAFPSMASFPLMVRTDVPP